MQLILSSSSPARRELLTRLKIPFICTSPDIDETPLANESVNDLTLRLAAAKAKKSAENHSNALIIGCDQVGELEGTILCKPLTHENAIKQLQFVSGKMVRFSTAICLFDTQTQTQQLAIETYDVYFRDLTPEMIEGYLRKEQPYQCAGSFRAEGLGITLIDKFHGDDYTALIGLPLIRLTKMLEKTQLKPILT